MKPRRGLAGVGAAKGPGELDKEQLYEECEQALEELLQDRMQQGEISFEKYEKSLLEIAHEVVRRRLEKKLQSISDGFPARLAIDHNNDWHGLREGTLFSYRRHCPGSATYHSLVGPLQVRRNTYRECRGGNNATYVPLELEAGLIEYMTPALAQSVAVGYAYMPPRTYERSMLAAGLRPPSRSTIDRAARDLGAYGVACNEEIEPLIRANEILDPRTRTVALGLDRSGVPMRAGEDGSGTRACHPDLRRSRPKPKRREEIRGPVQWRMDYVATVSFLSAEGERLATRKYRLPGEADVAEILQRVMADVRHALVQRPLKIAVVQDGAPELWGAVKTALMEEPLVSEWTEVLDWYHLDERLSKCLDLSTDARLRKSQRKRWHTQLLEGDSGVRPILRALRRKRAQLEGDAAAELDRHINYLSRNRHRTAYKAYRECGTPIGSGVTEGTCKSLIGVRAKRSGQRWSQRGLTAALHLRSIHDSDRFDAFWPFFAQRYRARHVVALGQG